MQLRLYCIVQFIAVLRLQQLSLSHNIFATYQQLSFSLKIFATNQQPSFIVSKLFATYQQLSFLTWAISLTLVRATIMSSVSRTMAGPAGCLPPLLFLENIQRREMHQRREKTNIFALEKRNKITGSGCCNVLAMEYLEDFLLRSGTWRGNFAIWGGKKLATNHHVICGTHYTVHC